ncbi:hypothetical protein D9M71_800310 [compost metagenome]
MANAVRTDCFARCADQRALGKISRVAVFQSADLVGQLRVGSAESLGLIVSPYVKGRRGYLQIAFLEHHRVIATAQYDIALGDGIAAVPDVLSGVAIQRAFDHGRCKVPAF